MASFLATETYCSREGKTLSECNWASDDSP